MEVMCNRTQASLKALQILGNSVRGLNFAQWWLAFNAICLPVLTYRCQLWYKGKQKSLVNKLQLVQNKAVKIISGSFRTAPREPLHHLLNIPPMSIRLNTLTASSALRLLRVPRASQTLKRLGSRWSTPEADDLPLPAPSRSHAKTALNVEIELARLVIRSLLVPYLSFSSTLMLSSMHHIDTHIF